MATLRSSSICSKHGHTVPAHWPHAEWTPPKNSHFTGRQAWELHEKLVTAAKHGCFPRRFFLRCFQCWNSVPTGLELRSKDQQETLTWSR